MTHTDSHPHSGHEHNHGFQKNRKALLIAIGITGAIMVVEVIGGILSNSLALLSDAGHMLTDLLSLLSEPHCPAD